MLDNNLTIVTDSSNKHEFQHYLDRLSFDTPEQWSLTYEKNVNYYEYKANRFASKKLKKLSKMLLKNIS